MYLVVASRRGAAHQRPNWLLVPVGDAWFDETFRGGAYRGAFTWAVGQVIREYNGSLTYDELISGVAWKLGDFAQVPQLGGPEELRVLRLFSAVR